jgi:hypothetical protein
MKFEAQSNEKQTRLFLLLLLRNLTIFPVQLGQRLWMKLLALKSDMQT